MREIKFRVWDVDEEEWYNNEKVPYQLIDNEGVFYWADDYEWDRYPGEVLIMQYTGLKDKNGTEIYEGDYVKCKWGHSDWSGIVEFIEGSFCSNPENPEKYPSAISECGDVEVIGNIYEHPYLLRGGSP